uniref:J domain-containing protein n=1 Tax=viral metagenome TaxID=1070528 RepID=A0A6C0EYY1_9ZZZZ
MDIQKARNILNLKYNYTPEDLKKNYRLLALKHHPDKNENSDESCEYFKEINAAYIYLLNFDISHDAHASHGFKGGDNQDAEDETGGPDSYISIFRVFIQSLLQKMTSVSKENTSTTINTLMKIIVEDCHELSLKMFEDLDKDAAYNIFEIITTYHKAFHISAEKLALFEMIMRNKMALDNLVVISVSLDDLFEPNNIYILEHDEKKFYIPLWHTELYYKLGEKDNTSVDLIVRCIPKTPSHIYIDANNDIYVDIRMKIADLLEKKCIEIDIGNRVFIVDAATLYIKNIQTHILRGAGIPIINTKNIYDTSEKSSIIFNIELV